MIVEVEAYVGEDDPACHAAPGPTRRNQPLYGPPGRAYVYLNYGIHALFNVVTERQGMPAAVLIRALEPLEGLDAMRRRRGLGSRQASSTSVHDLCRGPGNLTRAMGISLAHNQVDLSGDRVFVEDHGLRAAGIAWGSRVGITRGVDREWRAWIAGHPAVSRPETFGTRRRGSRGPE
jgi:DNA-3-methyladenine glycosylase